MNDSHENALMTIKYHTFRIYIKWRDNDIYSRVVLYTYGDMLNYLKKYLSYDNYKSIYVQYGNVYADCYRLNGIDNLIPHESTKMFKKMTLEYKLGDDNECLE